MTKISMKWALFEIIIFEGAKEFDLPRIDSIREHSRH